MTELRLFTSESVTEGHPDKICDQISDSILDAILADDPRRSRGGRDARHDGPGPRGGRGVDVDVRRDPRDRPRRRQPHRVHLERDGFRRRLVRRQRLHRRPVFRHRRRRRTTRSSIARTGSADPRDEQGAGDQGIMFGYATTETPQLMPMAIWTAHRMAEKLAETRRTGALPFLRPDGKTQVTLGLRRRRPEDDRVRRAVDAAPPRHLAGRRCVQRSAPRSSTPCSTLTGLDLPDVQVLHQPRRPVRHGRPEGRRGPHRPQDHHRHLRRRLPPRRRRVQRQGPVEGRPLRRVRDALGRQERRRRGPRRPARGAGRVRHRQGEPRRPLRRDASAPDASRTTSSPARSSTSSTCARRRSSTSSICCARSTRRRPPTATSAGSCRTSRGSAPTASTTCAPPPGVPWT